MQPVLQIHQTRGLVGLDIKPGQFSIRQPKADLTIQTTPGQWDIRQYRPELSIDQSKARAAYHGGNLLEMNARIYSGVEQIFLQGIAHRVELGNRMAAIHQPGNTIANIWGGDWKTTGIPEFRGPASMDNVDIRIETRSPDITYHKGTTDIQVEVNPPEIQYQMGDVRVYMRQYPSVSFTPPELDIQL